jgi:hypothetical protein
MKRKITFFAFGAKCGFGTSVPAAERIGLDASSIDAPTICANAIIPNPAPMVLSAWRRVSGSLWMMPQPSWSWSCFGILVSSLEGVVSR